MRVLLDTCVVSEIQRTNGNVFVREAVDALPNQDIFLSVLTIGEIVRGINQLEPGKKRQSLQQWVQTLENNFTGQILPVDIETCTIWGELTAQARKHGITIPAVDGLIAATAKRHGLYVMTRNISDFSATGAMLLNPWE